LPPSPAEFTSANLTPASGCQDHTTSPSASVPFVNGTSASIASHPAFVTTAKRPSVERDGDGYTSDLGQTRSGIFLQMGLDRFLPDGQITCRCSARPIAPWHFGRVSDLVARQTERPPSFRIRPQRAPTADEEGPVFARHGRRRLLAARRARPDRDTEGSWSQLDGFNRRESLGRSNSHGCCPTSQERTTP
jgi:hypothetical protein